MPTEPLPVFRYHPDPQATGSIEPTDTACPVCDRRRGLTYVGPTYAVDDVEGVCPWCIADGSAAARFAATFTDTGWGVPDDVPTVVLDEVSTRTPGFVGWQQEHWLYHCADAAAFLGRVGWTELQAHPEAIAMLEADAEAGELEGLHADGSATAYLFRCLACGTHLAYADAE